MAKAKTEKAAKHKTKKETKAAAKKTVAAAKPPAKSTKPKQTAEQKIREAQKGNKLLIGSRTVFKGVKSGTVSDVFHASNVPHDAMGDLERYTEISGIVVTKFNGDSAKLGEFCGKPFKVLLAAIKK